MVEKSTHQKLSEAGRKGGEASHSRRGSESEERQAMSRQEAGRMGGEKVAEERGSEFYSDIGKKGAEAEPREAKVRGGEHSHSGSSSSGSSSSERQGMSREEAGRRGAEAQPTEAKAKGGRHSHGGRD